MVRFANPSKSSFVTPPNCARLLLDVGRKGVEGPNVFQGQVAHPQPPLPARQLGVELVYGEVVNEEDGIGQDVGLPLHLGHHPANQLVEPREP